MTCKWSWTLRTLLPSPAVFDSLSFMVPTSIFLPLNELRRLPNSVKYCKVESQKGTTCIPIVLLLINVAKSHDCAFLFSNTMGSLWKSFKLHLWWFDRENIILLNTKNVKHMMILLVCLCQNLSVNLHRWSRVICRKKTFNISYLLLLQLLSRYIEPAS